jgi:hypothetical protein
MGLVLAMELLRRERGVEEVSICVVAGGDNGGGEQQKRTRSHQEKPHLLIYIYKLEYVRVHEKPADISHK